MKVSSPQNGDHMTKRADLAGQRFGKLEAIIPWYGIYNGYNKSYWTCLCDCGDFTMTTATKLLTGYTKSCGCLKSEATMIYKNPQHFSAHEVWRTNYKDGDITFEQFLVLSQMKCFYCNSNLSNRINSYIDKNGNITCTSVKKSRAEAAWFEYNGLDRLNNSRRHFIDNIVPCCCLCNCGKLNRKTDDFIGYVNLITGHHRELSVEDYRENYKLVDSSHSKKKGMRALLQSMMDSHKWENKHYGNGDLTREQFYQMTQMNCYYCGIEPFLVKKSNNKLHQVVYNGLDRINPKEKHNFSNCITACKWCNYMKSDYSYSDFIAWIDRIAAHKETWINLDFKTWKPSYSFPPQ